MIKQASESEAGVCLSIRAEFSNTCLMFGDKCRMWDVVIGSHVFPG